MISDVLFDAKQDIEEYLTVCPDAYPPEHPLTQRIKRLTVEMRDIQSILDAPPEVSE